MSNQKTLDIIREDLGHLVETEGTYWDSRHPHIFAVMGASVRSAIYHIFHTFNLCPNNRETWPKRRFIRLFGGFIVTIYCLQ